MNNIGDIFNLLLLQPIINLVILILKVLQSAGIPGALGFSIIILTILVKLVLWPFSKRQVESTRKMMELRPHLDKLKTKHKDDKAALAQAQMELYKEHGFNPAGGCLPMIIQTILILPLYQVINAFFATSGLSKINHFLYSSSWHLNSLPDTHFFGIDLKDKPSAFGHVGLFILLVPLVTAVTQLLLAKMMSPQPIKPYPADTIKEKVEKKTTDDSIMAMQGQMLLLMPLMIGYFSFTFPVGLSIYWITLTMISGVQQYIIMGWGGLSDWINRFLPVTHTQSK